MYNQAGADSASPPNNVRRLVPGPDSCFATPRRCAALLLALGIGVGRTVSGEAPRQDPVPSRIDVYLNDSFETKDLLSKARQFAEAGRWEDAALTVQQALDGPPDRLIQIEPGLYQSAHRRAQRWIATWPKDGLEAYRRFADPALRSALGSVDLLQLGELLPLYEQYFATSGAPDLADRIAALWIERGEFDSVEGIYREILAHHPDRQIHQLRIEAMLTLLDAIRGKQNQHLPEPIANVELPWKGEKRTTSEILREIQGSSDFESLRQSSRQDDWPIFAGSAHRSRLGSFDVDEPGLMWRFTWDAPDKSPPNENSPLRHANGRSVQLSVMPVLAGGLLFAQRFREIVALHVRTGAVAWRFQADLDGDEIISFLEDAPAGWDSPTYANGRLYATLPVMETPYFSFESTRAFSEVICLEAQTGQVVWRAGGAKSDNALAEIIFDSSPVVDAGFVSVVGRRKRAFGFEDAYLFVFDAPTGRLHRRVHLGSASTMGLGTKLSTKSIAAAHGSALYICSTLGTVASVSPPSGSVTWLRLYERIPPADSDSLSRTPREPGPWWFNPAVLVNQRLVCLPNDARRLLLFSSEDGAAQATIPVDQLAEAESILLIDDNRVYGIGARAFSFDLTSKEKVWEMPLPDGATLMGRGVATDGALLIPHTRGFSRFRLSDGVRTDFAWDEEGEPGNLLALQGQLIVAGADGISCYVRKSDLWQALRTRMQASPNDPLPAIELAEVAFGASAYQEAIDVLLEAIRRAGSNADSAVRRRLFNDILKFAETLARKNAATGEQLELLLIQAAGQAAQPQDHLAYRLTFAPLLEQYARHERAVQLYQQILRDRSLRELPAPGRGKLTAVSLAKNQIDRLIERQGRGVYAEFDQQAQRLLESARQNSDVDALARLIDSFPNSLAAPRAMIALADGLLQRNQPESAARFYIRAYHLYPTRIDRPALMRKIADAWLRAGRSDLAHQWLTHAANAYPTYRFEHQGKIFGLLEYRTAILPPGSRVAPAKPVVVPPLEGRFVIDPFTGALLTPRFSNNLRSAWTRYFTLSQDGLMAHDPLTGNPAWNAPATARANTQLLLLQDDLAVFTDLGQVFAIDPKTGTHQWTFGEPQPSDPAVDWEKKPSLRAIEHHAQSLYVAADDGRIAALEIPSGRVIWEMSRKPPPLGRMRAIDSWLVYHVVQDGRALLCLLDAHSGHWLGNIDTGERQAIEEIFLSLDGQVIVFTSQQVASYDIESRLLRWQTPLGGTLRRGSLVMDLDGVYASDSGADLRKISLTDGRILWQTERLAPRADDNMTVDRVDGTLIVSTLSSVTAVDSLTGLTLWQGTTPERVRFVDRLLTDQYLVALHLPLEPKGASAQLYFYDYRSADGALPKGGIVDAGIFNDPRLMIAVDGAILVHADAALHAFVKK